MFHLLPYPYSVRTFFGLHRPWGLIQPLFHNCKSINDMIRNVSGYVQKCFLWGPQNEMLSSPDVEITSSSQRVLIRAFFIAKPPSRAPLVSKFGNLSIREILVVTWAYVRTPVQTLGRRAGVPRQPDGSGECHLFLAENRAVPLGNRRFSWRKIAWPPSLLKKRCFEKL